MAVIHVLDKHTAELIAAGEVVERPASVVKELLENSIDAGATQVTVSIESGGVKLIEISDNGTGIDAEYIPTAFIRHATSKIEKPDDLNSIHTLGFRGEALASIASVARVELLTRTEVDEFATCYRIAGGEEQGREPAARAVGTTIRVQDLFYNTPARMKFLKKDSSEGTFVADNVGHVALSHPEVSVKFIREGKLQYVTPGDGQLRSAAYAVLGREFSRDLIEVYSEEGLYRVTGLITPPKSCRASRSMQHFYINGRYVRNRTMMAGMEMATATMMAETSFMAAAGTLNRSATATIKRYRQLPNTTPRMRRSMVRLPTSVSPMMREASAMVTMPVPTLISQLFWYCASSPPDSAHNAPDTHRPTVMVKAGLMLEARTMAALSPVARMESPSRVPRKPSIAAQAMAMTTAASASLYQLPRKLSEVFAMEKMVGVLTSDMVEEKPITARLMVYRPVLTMMPAMMLSTPRRVCRKAVTKPEHTPAAMAANSARMGWPVSAT